MRGWLIITAFVIGYDAWAGSTGNPTLSATFRDMSKKHRVVTLVGSAYMVTHLHGFIPTEHDPLGHLGRQYCRLGEIRTHNLPLRTRSLFR